METTNDSFTGKQLLILGLARQGKALAQFALQVGARVIVSDLRSAQQLQADMVELADLDITYVLGEHPLHLLDGTDILAISGGVPADIPFVQTARERGITITNDSQEFIKRTPATVIGITGAAGKSTTSALTGAMGKASDRQTWVGGNIGRPLIAELDEMQTGDLVVQELSSFQLEIWTQSPPIAAVLNITPNHLDRHRTMAAYSAAKANILRFQGADDVALLCADDPGSMTLKPLVNGRLRQFSIEREVTDGVFIQQDQIWLRDDGGQTTAVCPVEAIQLRGRHNLFNVCAAVALADSAGISSAAMEAAIREFHGVEHRLEVVATINGVSYVNDSIATAPERALAAIDAYDEPLVLLAGGKDKDMLWQAWAQRVHEGVKHVILFGQLADELEMALDEARMSVNGRLQSQVKVESLADAVAVASDTAVAGDIVLLSPGGTSFDAFVDFAARGIAFRQMVEQLAKENIGNVAPGRFPDCATGDTVRRPVASNIGR